VWTVRPAAVLIAAVPDRDRALVEETMKQRRDSIVSIRITDDEMARLRTKATARGTTVSELLRKAALDEPAPFPLQPSRLTRAVATTMSAHAVVIGDSRIQGGSTGIIWTGLPLGAQVDGSTLTLVGTVPKGTPPPSPPPKTNPPPNQGQRPPANPKR
jgi:hypothetical protein